MIFQKNTMTIRMLTIVIVTLAIFVSSYSTTKEMVEKEQIKVSVTVDTSIIAILPYNNSKHWIFKEAKPTELSNEDFQKIETILTKCITEYNEKLNKEYEKDKKIHPEVKLDLNIYLIDLTRYKRQYIEVINTKGQKEVWVNCFCNTRKRNWKKDIIFVNDGGNCYFKLKINLSTGQYYDFIVNGDA